MRRQMRIGRLEAYRMPEMFGAECAFGMQDNHTGIVTDGPDVATCWRTIQRVNAEGPPHAYSLAARGFAEDANA